MASQDKMAVAYLGVLFLVLGIVFVHFKVELRRGDGQRSGRHHAGRDQFGAAAQIHWAC